MNHIYNKISLQVISTTQNSSEWGENVTATAWECLSLYTDINIGKQSGVLRCEDRILTRGQSS